MLALPRSLRTDGARALPGAALLSALALVACGGGGVGTDSAAPIAIEATGIEATAIATAAASPSTAAWVDVQGCTVDHDLGPVVRGVRALLSDGRLVASARSGEDGVFLMRVPAGRTVQLVLDAADTAPLDVLTGRGNLSVAACLMDLRA